MGCSRRPPLQVAKKSDVWSFGCLLCSMALRELPYKQTRARRGRLLKWQAFCLPLEALQQLTLDVMRGSLPSDALNEVRAPPSEQAPHVSGGLAPIRVGRVEKTCS